MTMSHKNNKLTIHTKAENKSREMEELQMNMARSSSDETSEVFVHYSENQFEDLK